MDKTTWPPGIRPSGNGIGIRVWRKGKLAHSETLPGDPYSPRDLAAAERRRDDLKARVRLGLPLHQGDEEAQRQIFAEAAQDYIETLDAKRSTHISYENILNRYWIPVLGRDPVDEITRKQIRSALARLEISARTKKNILIPLRGVLAHAEVFSNPAAGLVIKQGQRPAVERYKPAERDKLLRRLTGQPLVYFALLFGCGLRPGEALGLTWPDYDGQELNIDKQITRRRLEPSTKTSMRRRVYVPKWVRPILNQHTTRFAGEHIFINSAGRPYLDTDVFNDAWRAAHKKARIPYRIPYTCRHTRAAELLSMGVDPGDAAKQLGHSMEMFLRIYSEWIEEYAKNRDMSRFEGVKADVKGNDS